MHNGSPLVSVVMPLHDSAAFMSSSIQSVREQSFTDWELLLVDDASRDGTLEIARQFVRDDSRIRLLVSAENGGPARARNMGIDAARGCYIAFLDSDDAWDPCKLEKQVDFMKREKAAFSFTGYTRRDDKGRSFYVGVSKRLSFDDLLKRQEIGCLTAMYDVSLCGKQRMPDIRLCDDYAMWLQITRAGFDAFGLDENLARYSVRPDSLSGNKIRAAYYVWLVYRRHARLGVLRSLYFFLRYVSRSTARLVRERG